MSSPSSTLTQIVATCGAEGLTPQNGEKIAAALAAEFNVKPEEVGILRVEEESLVFVHPAKLHKVGRIPLNSTSSLAVRTLHTRRPEAINNFTKTKHTAFFEMVDVGDKQAGPRLGKEYQTIQKIMTAPVNAGDKVLGVVQISRKGPTLTGVGPDFTPADLQKLIALSDALAKCFR